MSTRERQIGEDTPFGDWLRGQPELDAVVHGLTANDVDMMLHRYKNNVDGMGARSVALMMNVEVKTRGRLPNPSQLQALWFQHQLLNKRCSLQDVGADRKISVWHFGFFVLSLSGSRPDDSSELFWAQFGKDGRLEPEPLTYFQLLGVLGFQIHPETLQEMSLRRHHKTRQILMQETTPLGLVVERVLTRRS